MSSFFMSHKPLLCALLIVVLGAPSVAISAEQAEQLNRTRAEVEKLIKTVGPTKPDWFDSVEMKYPETLDLTWAKPKKKGFDLKENMDHYMVALMRKPWAWKSAVKLMYHIMDLQKGNRSTVRKAMRGLGEIYFKHLNDYARAAYWLRKGEKPNKIFLVDCYLRLGSKQMAYEELDKYQPTRWERDRVVKLLAEMGRVKDSLRYAQQMSKAGQGAMAYLAAGHACRYAGQLNKALLCYKRVLTFANEKYSKRFLERAQDSATAIKTLGAGLDLSKIPDGTYIDSSRGFRGPVEVTIEVKDSKILSVKVTDLTDDWHCSSIVDVPLKIVEKQSIVGVDSITSATFTSEAIINATAKALGKAMK